MDARPRCRTRAALYTLCSPMSYRFIEDGHVSSTPGFRATGVACGLKDVRARDLALVYSHYPATAAAIWTTNSLPAAPLFFDQAVMSRNTTMRAVLINTGQANAGTGPSGLLNAIECAKITADELEVPRDTVLLLSIGKIGVPLPMDRMRDGIRRAVSELDSGGGRRAAMAILMGDTRPKERALEVQLGDRRSAVISGMAKGGRLAHPRFSTVLAVITSNIAIDQPLLARALEYSVARSFGRLHIGGDNSPNDGIVMLANGQLDGPAITDPNSRAFGAFQEALDALCTDLAQQIIRDAVSGGKFVQIHVRGASTPEDARTLANTIADSDGVQWMCASGSTDWGALLEAIGASGVELRPDLLDVRLGNTLIMHEGLPFAHDHTTLLQSLSGGDIDILVDVHVGSSATTIWTSASTPDH